MRVNRDRKGVVKEAPAQSQTYSSCSVIKEKLVLKIKTETKGEQNALLSNVSQIVSPFFASPKYLS